MKKLILFIGIVAMPLFGCSKSDDAQEEEDDIFLLEYRELKDLNELKNKVFFYVGIKKGDAKTSMLIPNSRSCRAHEFFSQAKSNAYPTLEFSYIKMENGALGCEITTSVYFLTNNLIRDGILQTTLKEGVPSESGIQLLPKDAIYRGPIEIGFQGDYLRIEDRMSAYQREDPNEKVYLYFSLQKR